MSLDPTGEVCPNSHKFACGRASMAFIARTQHDRGSETCEESPCRLPPYSNRRILTIDPAQTGECRWKPLII